MSRFAFAHWLIVGVVWVASGWTSAAEPDVVKRHEWPQYKGSAGFTGVSADDVLKPPLKLLWTYRTDGDATGEGGQGLIVADGKVFVSLDIEGSILALDAITGDFLWEAGNGVSGRMAPSYSNGRLFVWVRKGARSELLALDAATGKTIWRHAIPVKGADFAGLAQWGVAILDGKVFCSRGGADPAVFALDEKTGKPVWQTPLGVDDGTFVVPPTAVNGKVFVGVRSALIAKKNMLGALLALDASDGKILWRRKNIYPFLQLSSDGQVVACGMKYSPDEKFYLLDAKNGETLWSTAPGLGRYPATVTPDWVLLKNYGPSFKVLDRKTGKVAWTFREPGVSGCCVPAVAGNHAYFGTGAPAVNGLALPSWSFAKYRENGYGYNLYAVDLATGKTAWKFVLGKNVCAMPAIAYGRLYATGMDGRVYCFAPANPGEPTVPEAKDKSPTIAAEQVQALLAQKRDNPPRAGKDWPMAGGTLERDGLTGATLRPPLELAWKVDAGGPVQTASAVVAGKVYVGSDSGSLLALDASTGRMLWKFPTGDKVRCSPAVAGGSVYFGSNDGKFYAVDTASGKAAWSFEAGGPVRAAPAVVGDVVVFGADDHQVYALNRLTGRKLWSFRTNHYSIEAPPVVHGDQVFVAPWLDWVYALDIATGNVQWRSYVPRSVEALAFVRNNLWVRAATALVELDPKTGHRLRFVVPAPYGRGGLAIANNRMFVAGLTGAALCDLDDKGSDPPKVATLDDVRRLSLRHFKSLGTLSATATPLVLGENVCFVSREGKLILAELQGKEVWTYAMGATCHSSPVAADGLLIVGNDQGWIHAFRRK